MEKGEQQEKIIPAQMKGDLFTIIAFPFDVYSGSLYLCAQKKII